MFRTEKFIRPVFLYVIQEDRSFSGASFEAGKNGITVFGTEGRGTGEISFFAEPDIG